MSEQRVSDEELERRVLSLEKEARLAGISVEKVASYNRHAAERLDLRDARAKIKMLEQGATDEH